MRLQGKAVFLTDADSPSGKALIPRLYEEDARLLLSSDSGGEAIAAELEGCRSVGKSVIVGRIDPCDGGQVGDLLDRAQRQWGAVDVLVHNRSPVKPASVETCEESLFRELIDAGAKSAFIAAQAAGARMAAKGAGTILFIGSIHAEKPTGSSFAFSAAMGAVQMLSREASLALGRHGITVNHIQMGPVLGDDERFGSGISALYEDYRFKVPGTELVTYRDLANLVIFLASQEARHLNGADIRLDGGFLNHYLDVKMNKPINGGD